jgi:dethiobiotin synthetase
LVSNTKTVFHPETYRLTQPYSPHKSAELDGITIDPRRIILPETDNRLIIEGAGGLMVPLNADFLMIDLIRQLNTEVILVSQNYLGSINHTLLSIKMLRQYNLPIMGIIFNGDKNEDTENYILNHSQIKLLGCIPTLQIIDKETVIKASGIITL